MVLAEIADLSTSEEVDIVDQLAARRKAQAAGDA